MAVPINMTIGPQQSHDENGNGNGNGNGRAKLRVDENGLHLTREVAPRPLYDCSKCPGYCCSYAKIVVDRRDIDRLAKRFELTRDAAELRFTKIVDGEIVLRHQKDDVYGSVCTFFDKDERRCTVYEARPAVCREYPERRRCGYYDFLLWERRHQGDGEFVPLRKE